MGLPDLPDAALKLTDIRLGLLSDTNMLLMVRRCVRGGICTVPNRFEKANNKCMGKSYDPEIPSTFITYFYLNNIRVGNE